MPGDVRSVRIIRMLFIPMKSQAIEKQKQTSEVAAKEKN
jgi:hypothetical protein